MSGFVLDHKQEGFDNLSSSSLEIDGRARMFRWRCKYSYSVWINKTIRVICDTLEVALPNQSGHLIIVLLPDLQLQVCMLDTPIPKNSLLIAKVYWNSDQQHGLIVNDVRRLMGSRSSSQSSLVIKSGFDLLHYDLLADRTTSACCTFMVTGGEYQFYDRNVLVLDSAVTLCSSGAAIAHQTNGVVFSCLPVFYSSGIRQVWFYWKSDIPVPFIVIHKIPQMNVRHSITGWNLAPISYEAYFPVFLVLVPNERYPVVAISPQKWYVSKSLALQQNEAQALSSVGPWLNW